MKPYAFVLLFAGVVLAGGAIPGNLGVDHVGVVVRNATLARDFLIDAFGCVFDWEVIRDPKPDAGERGWDKVFGVHPNSYLKHALMLKCGPYHLAQYLELFEWAGMPDQFDPGDDWLRFSDIGSSYIAFTVESVAAVVNHLREVVFPKYAGTRFIQDPPMSFPLRGELCTSFFIVSPWGQWIEISEWSESTPQHPHNSAATSALSNCASEPQADAKRPSGSAGSTSTAHSALIGAPLAQVETPAVVIDLDAVDFNIDLLKTRLGQVRWMPPVKAHRSPALGAYLLNKGAAGLVVMKVAEAEVFARSSELRDFHERFVIHVANEIVVPSKILRLCNLVKSQPKIDFRVNCDCDQNAADLSNAAKGAGVELNVFIEVNIGHNRTGVSPAQAASLAKLIQSKPNLIFGGLHGYEGHTPVLAPEEKTRATHAAHEKLREAKLAIESVGISVPVVSAGGSSNYIDALNEGIINELQAGGGVTISDKLYLHLAHLANHGHRPAVRVESTVMSVQSDPTRAVADAGFKSVGWHPFAGMPLVLTEGTCLEVTGLSAEHARMRPTENCTMAVRLGQRISLLPGYGDSFLGNQKQLYAVRSDVIEQVFVVEAFGAST
jgi:D-serine deaminase-like pyridoxal phosphate-dependent protein